MVAPLGTEITTSQILQQLPPHFRKNRRQSQVAAGSLCSTSHRHAQTGRTATQEGCNGGRRAYPKVPGQAGHHGPGSGDEGTLPGSGHFPECDSGVSFTNIDHLGDGEFTGRRLRYRNRESGQEGVGSENTIPVVTAGKSGPTAFGLLRYVGLERLCGRVAVGAEQTQKVIAAQPWERLLAEIGPVTAPPVLTRAVYKARSDGVEMDVPNEIEEVNAVLH